MEPTRSPSSAPGADKLFLLAVLASLVGSTLLSGGMAVGIAAGVFNETAIEVARAD